ncbi:unnamed protein product [Prunus armeniaca]
MEQPKKEIPIKMPRNEKPLATIIEGIWYFVGKSGRPTLELTRTQKMRVQRQDQLCQKREESESTPLDRTNNLPATKVKAKSPSRSSIHLASSSVNQFEPSQAQGESEPIPVEEQEDWTEEYKEEQLDYEPSADDQNRLLETGEHEDWTEEYGEEQMEYDGELDEETEAFGAELESLL